MADRNAVASRADRRRWIGAGLGALVLGLVAGVGSCVIAGGDPVESATPTTSAPRGGRPAPSQVAALTAPATADDPGATTTDPPAGHGGSGGDPSGDDRGGPDADRAAVPPRVGTIATSGNCVAIERVVLPPARVITQQNFVEPDDLAARPRGSSATVAEIRLVAALVPAENRSTWQDLVAAIASSDGAPSDELSQRTVAAVDAVEAWARETCPDAPPSWRCNAYGSADDSVLDLEADGGEASTPESVVARVDDVDGAVEVDRTDDQVLYAWLDGGGFVTRTLQVGRGRDGWAVAGFHSCLA